MAERIRHRPELLAPAGSFEALRAAVQAGADAVYLGFGDHNARRGAANFTPESFADAVAYCHIRGVKVYLTLNTLLFDGELRRAEEEIVLADAAGADAVLVQDLGMLKIVRSVAPDLPVHASTQMSLCNLDGVRAAADLGCTRAVLARELPAEEIADICAHSPIEIEVFVHGALCMCYSGQCFFSSVVGTRSGNRGLCAQPCRRLYGWDDAAVSPLLSLKDLSLASHLRELSEMGVACLKIEGRMRRPEYVSIVTGIYAAALREGRDPTLKEEEALRAAFSRQGFTDGYFTGRLGEEMFGARPEREEPPSELFAAARADYAKEQKLVSLTGHFTMHRDAPISLTLSDGTHEVTAVGEKPDSARKRDVAEREALAQLCKTGGTPYVIADLRADTETGLYVSAARLNALRREALASLSAQRSTPPVHRRGISPPAADDRGRSSDPPVLTISLHSKAQLTDELLAYRPAVLYLPVETATELCERIPGISAMGIECAVILPRVLWDREIPALEAQLRKLRSAGICSALVTNPGGIALAQRVGLTLRGDFGLAVTNAETAAVYRDLGLRSVTLSFEERLSRLCAQKKPLPSELLAYGRAPLMITENCLYRIRDGGCRKGCAEEAGITDAHHVRFPVLRAYGCRNEILNCLPVWLADRRKDLEDGGFWALRLRFTTESPETCAAVADAYQNGLPAEAEYTRGLYYRNVK